MLPVSTGRKVLWWTSLSSRFWSYLSKVWALPTLMNHPWVISSFTFSLGCYCWCSWTLLWLKKLFRLKKLIWLNSTESQHICLFCCIKGTKTIYVINQVLSWIERCICSRWEVNICDCTKTYTCLRCWKNDHFYVCMQEHCSSAAVPSTT